MAKPLSTVLVDTAELKIQVIAADLPGGQDDDSLTEYFHESKTFVFGDNDLEGAAWIDWAAQVSASALASIGGMLTGGHGRAALHYSPRAGCGMCDCSPGFLTGQRLRYTFAQDAAQEDRLVDVYVTVKDARPAS